MKKFWIEAQGKESYSRPREQSLTKSPSMVATGTYKLSITIRQNSRKLVPFGKVTKIMIAYIQSAYHFSGRVLSFYTLAHSIFSTVC